MQVSGLSDGWTDGTTLSFYGSIPFGAGGIALIGRWIDMDVTVVHLRREPTDKGAMALYPLHFRIMKKFTLFRQAVLLLRPFGKRFCSDAGEIGNGADGSAALVGTWERESLYWQEKEAGRIIYEDTCCSRTERMILGEDGRCRFGAYVADRWVWDDAGRWSCRAGRLTNTFPDGGSDESVTVSIQELTATTLVLADSEKYRAEGVVCEYYARAAYRRIVD